MNSNNVIFYYIFLNQSCQNIAMFTVYKNKLDVMDPCYIKYTINDIEL